MSRQQLDKVLTDVSQDLQRALGEVYRALYIMMYQQAEDLGILIDSHPAVNSFNEMGAEFESESDISCSLLPEKGAQQFSIDIVDDVLQIRYFVPL
jgi:hypothetical protein